MFLILSFLPSVCASKYVSKRERRGGGLESRHHAYLFGVVRVRLRMRRGDLEMNRWVVDGGLLLLIYVFYLTSVSRVLSVNVDRE